MDVGSLIVTSVPFWWGMLIVAEALCLCGGREYMVTVLSAQFFCETKTALRNNVYFKRKEMGFWVSSQKQMQSSYGGWIQAAQDSHNYMLTIT